MSMIVIGLVAAGCAGVSGLLAARALRKRRLAAAPEPEAPEPAEPDPFAGLPARVGDVVQFAEVTRWPTAAILLSADDRLHCAILLSRDGEKEEATVVMPAPHRHIYWLVRREMTLPPGAPSRLEVDGLLLDRAASLPVALRTIGAAPAVGKEATFALYHGSVGDAAVALMAESTHIWYGQRIEPDDFDNLGQVDPEE